MALPEPGAPHEPNAHASAAVGPHHAGDRLRAPLGAGAIIGRVHCLRPSHAPELPRNPRAASAAHDADESGAVREGWGEDVPRGVGAGVLKMDTQ